jgi:hypothetical protein
MKKTRSPFALDVRFRRLYRFRSMQQYGLSSCSSAFLFPTFLCDHLPSVHISSLPSSAIIFPTFLCIPLPYLPLRSSSFSSYFLHHFHVLKRRESGFILELVLRFEWPSFLCPFWLVVSLTDFLSFLCYWRHLLFGDCYLVFDLVVPLFAYW